MMAEISFIHYLPVATDAPGVRRGLLYLEGLADGEHHGAFPEIL